MVVRNAFQTGYPESLKTARGGIDQEGVLNSPPTRAKLISLLNHLGVAREGKGVERAKNGEQGMSIQLSD